MMEHIFWDVFKKTGNIEAYLASKDYRKENLYMEASEEISPDIAIQQSKKDKKNLRKKDG
jgi:hypothetical protein